VAVVGGGPSGLMAAITAAGAGASVCLLERQDRVGRKLLATGNGRCNLSHENVADTNYHGRRPGFVSAVLRQFGVAGTLAFFDNLGVLTTIEDDGEIYPLCGQASAVLDVLRLEAQRLGVRTMVGAEVSRIVAGKRSFTVMHVSERTEAAAVVLAAGGKAMPQLGGGESGIRLATSLGHRFVPAYAGLVPLKTDCPYNRQLKGTKVDATVTLDIAGGSTRSLRGEVLFTEYGLSGPPLIQLSLPAAGALHDGSAVRLALDLFPDWSQSTLSEHLRSRFERAGDAPLEHALIGFCNKRLILPLLATAGLARTAPAGGSVTLAPRLAALCKTWTLTVTGSLSYNEAHVMCGGIDCADVDPESLESRKVDALYLAGELLDVTGDCGGYNLQWAWSSGHVAGSRAAESASGRR
jgi:predicted Rossmann fold flavoprotein